MVEMAKWQTLKHEMVCNMLSRKEIKSNIWMCTISAEEKAIEKHQHMLETYNGDEKMDHNILQKQVDEILPDNYLMITLTMDAGKKYIYLGRKEKLQSPILIRIPIERKEEEGGRNEYQQTMHRFEEILQESKSDSMQQEKGKVDARRWWKERDKLDKKLEILLSDIEARFLGGFKVKIILVFKF